MGNVYEEAAGEFEEDHTQDIAAVSDNTSSITMKSLQSPG
jgi:hypothetical protein